MRRTSAAAALLGLLVARPVVAGEPGDGETTVQAQATGYLQVDRGGIAEVDEDASVLEGIIVLDADVAEHDRLRAEVLADVVSAASIRREHNQRFRSLQSGASGTIRYSGKLGWLHRFGDLDAGVHGSAATEYAYRSLGAGAGLAWRLFEKDTTLTLDVDAFFDTVAMIRYNGTDEPDQGRTTVSASLGWTQLLTPRALLSWVAAYTHQAGFLAGQFNSVFIDGVEDYEILPRARERGSITARLRHAIGTLDAFEAGARYYHDSWGIDAGTADLRYFFHFSKRHQVELGYRLHVQGAADHYRSSFSAASAGAAYRTSDPDLGDFTGHMARLYYRFFDTDSRGAGGDWGVGLSYYYRDNGLHMMWLTLGYTFGL